MMFFFFGVTALRAFFLEHHSDWFAQRVLHRMRFTADIPKPNLESLFDTRFGVVLLAIVFVTFVVAVTSGMSLLQKILLILQVVVMAGFTVKLGPQLIDGEVTPETFTDYSVLTIIMMVLGGITAVADFRCGARWLRNWFGCWRYHGQCIPADSRDLGCDDDQCEHVGKKLPCVRDSELSV